VSATRAFEGRPLDATRYWTLKRRGAAWPEILGKSQVTLRFQEAFIDRFVAWIEAPASLGLDRLFPGTKLALETLGRQGDRLVLLSLRRSSSAFLQQVSDLGLAQLFEWTRTGHTQAVGHLDKIELIRQAGFSPPAAVVGDTEADVLAARELGLAAVAVSSGLRNRSYLRRVGADVVLDGVRQVPEALRSARVGMSPRRPGRPSRPPG
jgi:phosphoglycolate phosphatase